MGECVGYQQEIRYEWTNIFGTCPEAAKTLGIIGSVVITIEIVFKLFIFFKFKRKKKAEEVGDTSDT